MHFFAASPIENLQNVGLMTGFSVQQFLSQLIVFLIVCALLWRFAYQPVFVVLDKRRKIIEENMSNADRIKKELADAEAARLNIIQKANERANAIVDESHKVAAGLAERLAQEAALQAQDIIRKAHEAAVLDRDKLLNELKRQVGALVIQTTEKVAGKILTADDQVRLNNETLQQLSAESN